MTFRDTSPEAAVTFLTYTRSRKKGGGQPQAAPLCTFREATSGAEVLGQFKGPGFLGDWRIPSLRRALEPQLPNLQNGYDNDNPTNLL